MADSEYYKSFKYPEIAQRKGILGTVEIQFTIDSKGKVKNTSITKGVNEILDRYAYHFISDMPDWKPATLNGEAIEVYKTVRLNFKLN